MVAQPPASSYVPARGDIIWIDFSPQAGHEQAGYRPALVLSPGDYNMTTSLVLCCPITSQAKGYPYEYPLPVGGPITGVVLADHVKSMDWRARGARFADHASPQVVADAFEMLKTILPDSQ